MNDALRGVVATKDTAAIAIFIFLGCLPDGQDANAKELMAFFKLGRSRFYRARKILLDAGMIVERRLHDKSGLFNGTRYCVSHETACMKTALRIDEKVQTDELAQKLIITNVEQNNVEQNNGEQNNVELLLDTLQVNTDDSQNVGDGLINNYPEDFERVWNAIPPTFGAKGSKQLAAKEFKKLKLTDAQINELLKMIQNEVSRKKQAIALEKWEPNFPHVVRILKGRLWESWLIKPTSPTLTEVIL